MASRKPLILRACEKIGMRFAKRRKQLLVVPAKAGTQASATPEFPSDGDALPDFSKSSCRERAPTCVGATVVSHVGFFHQL